MRTFIHFSAMFLLMLPLCVRAQLGALQVTFGADSLYACVNEPYELRVVISGGTAPYQLVWNTGDTDTSLTFLPAVGAVLYSVQVTDDNGATAVDSVWLTGLPECVWPGDANGDGAANNLDLLSIGRAYGVPGMTRPNPHFNWIGQPAPSWTHTFSNGVNYAHVDTDGNGFVDAPDIHGILHNYVLPQAQLGGSGLSPQGIPLYLDIPTGTNNPGDTVIASIMLGTSAVPADSIYGIAFTISYDAALVDSGSAYIDFSGSWLGDTAVDMKGIGRDFSDAHQIDVALTRTDLQSRNGFGRIADIIITIDDIAGKSSGIKMLDIDIRQVWLIGRDGNPIDISLQPAQVAVVLSNELPLALQSSIRIYPNPATEQVTIEINRSELARGASMTWANMQGQIIHQQELSGIEKMVFPVRTLPSGWYLVEVNTSMGTVRQKIFIH
jgi:hypothetical protein